MDAPSLDLRKAFDAVNHSVPLFKLSKVKLSVNVRNWIQCYLLERSQRSQLPVNLKTCTDFQILKG